MPVCRQARKRCRHILDIYTNCWKTTEGIETPGTALLAGWYDACVGLLPSPERLNSFNFTLPFTPNTRAALHYRRARIEGSAKNLTGRKLGFIAGWAVGRQCLSRQLVYTGEYEAAMFDRHEDMVAALMRGDIDALLTTEALNTGKLRLRAIAPWFSCTTQGPSVMAHYGSDVIDWWNKAFQELKDTGKYETLCERAAVDHGAPSCVFV
ncbi:hypothetical protein LSAT2_023120 [Lamellibrachia satsuma]|nr:hypothetical protein LSAT2_023120 [Lamellibrachia satsuma]